MSIRRKRWSEMSAEELAAATHEFDDPAYDPPPLKPSGREAAALRRVQQKAKASPIRVAVALEAKLVEQADEYAARHGVTFSDVVSDALRRLMRRKSA